MLFKLSCGGIYKEAKNKIIYPNFPYLYPYLIQRSMVKRFFVALFLGIVLLSCNHNRLDDVDTDKIDVSVTVQRFDQDLFAVNPDSIAAEVPALEGEYGNFADLFFEGIIRVGRSTEPQYYTYLARFLTDTMVNNAYHRAQLVFPNLVSLNQSITDAFRRYRYHFPGKTVPKVYSFVSGYNLSVAVGDSLVAIGLDRYLGSDTPQYAMLGIARYMTGKMTPQKIPSDVVKAWLYGEFPFNDSINNLLSNMIYEGELVYITRHLLPDEPETLIHGFTQEQLSWCKKNEKDMWTHLIENKSLFTTNSFDINKFINDAPFTSGFPQESPGRAAVWVGYRIIESFMERNDTISLSDLMGIGDYQKILGMARYKP